MPHAAPIDLPAFLDRLRAAGELVEVDSEVDPRLEMAEVHRRVIAADGPALLFKRPRGAAFPAVTNLFGTARRVKLAFGDRPEEIVERVAERHGLAVVDAHVALARGRDRALMWWDFAHLSSHGHALLAATLQPAIEAALADQETPASGSTP